MNQQMRIQLTCQWTFPVMQVAILGLSSVWSQNRDSSFAAAYVIPLFRWCCCGKKLSFCCKIRGPSCPQYYLPL